MLLEQLPQALLASPGPLPRCQSPLLGEPDGEQCSILLGSHGALGSPLVLRLVLVCLHKMSLHPPFAPTDPAPFPSMNVRYHRLQALPNTSFNERLKFDGSLCIGISASNDDFSGKGLDGDTGIFQLHPYVIGGRVLF
jgi:hypothetical protein